MATNGFKITNIGFRTKDYELEKGQYIYSLEIKPTGTSFNFGFSYKGSSTINTVSVTGLTANVRQRVEKVFNLTDTIDKFYPCRQLNAEIFQPVINKGTKAIDPSVNPDDASAGIRIEVDKLTLQVSQKTSTSDVQSMIQLEADSIMSVVNQKTSTSDVSTMISQSATDIKLAVKNDLDETGIDIANKTITVKADTFEIKDNNGNRQFVFDSKNGQPIFKTDLIDTDSLIAKKLQTPFLETQASNTSQFQADLLEGRNIIYGGGGQIKYTWQNISLPTGYNGLSVNIHSRGGTPHRLRLTNSNGLIFEDNRVVGNIKLLPFVNERISLLSSVSGGRTDWTVTSRTSFIPRQDGGGLIFYYPSILKPGDIIFRARVASNGSVVALTNNWYNGYNYSHSNNKRWYFGELTYFTTSGGLSYVSLQDKVTVLFTGAGTVTKNIEPIYQWNNGLVWAGGLGDEEYIITLIATDYINQSPYAEL